MTNEPNAYTALEGVKPEPEAEAPKRRRRTKDEDFAEQEQLTDEEINAPGRKWYFDAFPPLQ